MPGFFFDWMYLLAGIQLGAIAGLIPAKP